MTVKEIRQLFRDYTFYQKQLANIDLRIEYFESKAERITPVYEKSEGQASLDVSSKVEINGIKAVDLLDYKNRLSEQLELADYLLSLCKSHQRYLIKACLIHHTSYGKIAFRENTSGKNIEKIIDHALIQLSEKTELKQ